MVTEDYQTKTSIPQAASLFIICINSCFYSVIPDGAGNYKALPQRVN
jgi:hypothetical protein